MTTSGGSPRPRSFSSGPPKRRPGAPPQDRLHDAGLLFHGPARPMDRWEHIGAYEVHSKAHPDPVRETFLLLIRGTAQCIDGRFDEVLVSAQPGASGSPRSSGSGSQTLASVLRLQCIRERSGFAPVIDPLLELLTDLPDDESPTAPVAIRPSVLAESGRKSEAADLIVERGRHSFADIPDDGAFVTRKPLGRGIGPGGRPPLVPGPGRSGPGARRCPPGDRGVLLGGDLPVPGDPFVGARR